MTLQDLTIRCDKPRNKSLIEMCIGTQWAHSLDEYLGCLTSDANLLFNKSNDMLTLSSRVTSNSLQ